MEETTSKYGNFYWCIKTIEALSPNKEIYVMADRIDVTPTGDLLCVGHSAKEDRAPVTVLAIARGQWTAFYAASVMDGSAIAVDHWKGEVVR